MVDFSTFNPKSPDSSLVPDAESHKEVTDWAKKEEHRKDKEKTAMHVAFVWLIRISAILVYSILIVRVWHFICPSQCRWLSNEEVQGIDKILFSGAIGGFLGRSMKSIRGDSE